ncbi:hypothetical protein ANCDUO_17190 [Ancylostoma duodenale]|uniref:Uncharacterized protein n=1 Tax=Ancylostoma duodenale TaxID=51022 RepID=A0A0C2G6K6_9BILA|nr:hypothetical protein ANCDUO_17190 [Ancylostoma duodenale]
MGYFDEHPLIWKDFEKAGYTTYYAEDYPVFNLFSYLAKGFRRKPVHHYFSVHREEREAFFDSSNAGLTDWVESVAMDRNCKEAGVPEEFCMCYPETVVDINSQLIQRLSRELISQLNGLLAAHKDCARLTLSKVRHATKVEDEFAGVEAKYRITVEATPSLGVFEALMLYNKAANTSAVRGNVNRVNSYGNQSICVHEPELRKYCYCTSTAE